MARLKKGYLMRGDIAYLIYGVHEGRKEDCFFGAFRTVAEAEREIAKLQLQEMHGRNWAEQYHNRGFAIRETVIQTDFEIPPRPKPRDRYFVRGTLKENRPGTWPSTIVEVFRRGDTGGKLEKLCEYERNYSLLQTFEPFRQGGREFALISPDYTRTFAASPITDFGAGWVNKTDQQTGALPEESESAPSKPTSRFLPPLAAGSS